MPAGRDILISTLNELPSPALTHDPSSPTTYPDSAPATPGLVGVDPSHPIWIFDSSLREVDFDVTCLRALDEQLLHSPKDCFLDVCWAEAVYDEVEPVLQPEPEPEPQVMRSRKERKGDHLQRRLDPITVRVERKPVSVLCRPCIHYHI